MSCSTCEGSTNILCFIQLSISWRTATSEHISDKLNIPDDLIRDVRWVRSFIQSDKIHKKCIDYQGNYASSTSRISYISLHIKEICYFS